MRKMKEHQKRGLGWYRDFTLSVIAGTCLLFALATAIEVHAGRGSAIDIKIVVGLFILILLCIFLSPNKTFILIGAFSTVAGLMLPKLLTTGDLYSLGTVLAMLISVAVVAGLRGLISFHRGRRSAQRSRVAGGPD